MMLMPNFLFYMDLEQSNHLYMLAYILNLLFYYHTHTLLELLYQNLKLYIKFQTPNLDVFLQVHQQLLVLLDILMNLYLHLLQLL